MEADVFFQSGVLVSGEGPVEETFADVVYCLCGRVAHVFGVETVVAKFVHHDFV